MSRMKRCVALMLAAIMLLSILSLSGCKKKDGTGGGTGDPSTSTGDPVGDGTGQDIAGVPAEEDILFDSRVLPVGVMPLPVGESVLRGAEAQGSFVMNSGEESAAVLIPLDSVQQGTVISIPVEFDGITFPIMAYATGEEEQNFCLAFGVSTSDGICDGVGYSQVFYQDYPNFIVCNDCGQILRLDAMEVSQDQSRIYCHPYPIPHEDVQCVAVSETTLTAFSPYNWISTEETGEYSKGVSFVQPASLVGTRCLVVSYSVIKEAYDTFMSWEQERATSISDAAGSTATT